MIEALITDCNGVARGKWIPRNKILPAMKDGLKLPKSALGLDIWGRDIPELAHANGDIDGYCEVVYDSLRPVLTPRGADQAQLGACLHVLLERDAARDCAVAVEVLTEGVGHARPVVALDQAVEELDVAGTFLRGRWELSGDHEVLWINGYEWHDRDSTQHTDANPNNLAVSRFTDEAWQFTSDLRIESHWSDTLSTIFGGYFIIEDLDAFNMFDLPIQGSIVAG